MQGTNAADGTAWALRIIEEPVPHSGALAPMSCAGKNALPPAKMATATTASIPVASPTRLMLHRCSTIGGRAGASARNSPSRSRRSRFRNARSWVGLATPRVAAKASASSAGLKWLRARW